MQSLHLSTNTITDVLTNSQTKYVDDDVSNLNEIKDFDSESFIENYTFPSLPLKEDNSSYLNENLSINEILEENEINSSKCSSSILINNENYINYFMNIEQNKISTCGSFGDDMLNKKTKRLDKNDGKLEGVLFDSVLNKTFIEKDNPVEYRKAKKRIQNRESASRMKKLKENENLKNEQEMYFLKHLNLKLIKENISLKKEKAFLIEQIKLIQNIIKTSVLPQLQKSSLNSTIEKITNQISIQQQNLESEKESKRQEIIFYSQDKSKNKLKTKLFNVFLICFLSVFYIAGESYTNEIQMKKGEFNFGVKNIQLNSVENEGKNNDENIWYYIWKIMSIVILFWIFALIFPWIKDLFSFVKRLCLKTKRIFCKEKYKYK